MQVRIFCVPLLYLRREDSLLGSAIRVLRSLSVWNGQSMRIPRFFFVYSLNQESVQTAKISGYENTHRKND